MTWVEIYFDGSFLCQYFLCLYQYSFYIHRLHCREFKVEVFKENHKKLKKIAPILQRHTVGQDRQKCKETSNLDVIVMNVNRAQYIWPKNS